MSLSSSGDANRAKQVQVVPTRSENGRRKIVDYRLSFRDQFHARIRPHFLGWGRTKQYVVSSVYPSIPVLGSLHSADRNDLSPFKLGRPLSPVATRPHDLPSAPILDLSRFPLDAAPFLGGHPTGSIGF